MQREYAILTKSKYSENYLMKRYLNKESFIPELEWFSPETRGWRLCTYLYTIISLYLDIYFISVLNNSQRGEPEPFLEKSERN